jgi:hypothetical protein
MKTFSKLLTSANLLALNAMPITIVPSSGAGKIVIPWFAMFEYLPGSTGYTFPAAQTNRLGLFNGSIGSTDALVVSKVFCCIYNMDITNTSHQIEACSFNAGNNGARTNLTQTKAAIEAQPLVARFVRATTTGELTLGDGTLQVTVYYTVETLQ